MLENKEHHEICLDTAIKKTARPSAGTSQQVVGQILLTSTSITLIIEALGFAKGRVVGLNIANYDLDQLKLVLMSPENSIRQTMQPTTSHSRPCQGPYLVSNQTEKKFHLEVDFHGSNFYVISWDMSNVSWYFQYFFHIFNVQCWHIKLIRGNCSICIVHVTIGILPQLSTFNNPIKSIYRYPLSQGDLLNLWVIYGIDIGWHLVHIL